MSICPDSEHGRQSREDLHEGRFLFPHMRNEAL